MREFDERAKNFQLFLLSKFPWVNWPDYLHVGLGHATELLKECDSLALYSAQSKEAKNRLTRIFKERFSRKHTNILSIQDVFTRDWILTSPVLRGVGTTKPERKRNHRCSKLSRSTPHWSPNCHPLLFPVRRSSNQAFNLCVYSTSAIQNTQIQKQYNCLIVLKCDILVEEGVVLEWHSVLIILCPKKRWVLFRSNFVPCCATRLGSPRPRF